MEPREHRRKRVPLPLYVSGHGSVYTKSIELTASDLSAGGLSFETSKRISLDADSRVVVSGLEGLPDGAFIHGRVVYRKKLGSGRYRVGIEFHEFVNVEREELVELLETTDQDWALTPTPAP
jgi:c-di-GMP-binding flagellar brake protein YcgR